MNCDLKSNKQIRRNKMEIQQNYKMSRRNAIENEFIHVIETFEVL